MVSVFSNLNNAMCYVFIQDKFQMFAPLNRTLNSLEEKTGIVEEVKTRWGRPKWVVESSFWRSKSNDFLIKTYKWC
jgi:hypothetical protein